MSDLTPPLLISRLDLERIETLLERAPDSPAFADLRRELDRAEVREPQAMPADVITMRSTARFVDESSGEEREMTLVYPPQADSSAGRISILAPIGSALLGLRVGQQIDWPLPGGRRARLRVLAISDQPEASGDFAS